MIESDEFQQVMTEVSDLKRQMVEIDRLAADYSDRVRELSTNLLILSGHFESGADAASEYGIELVKDLVKSKDYKSAAKATAGIGALKLGAAALKKVTTVATDKLRERERKKVEEKKRVALAALIEERKELAELKLDFVESVFPRLERCHERLEEFAVHISKRQLGDISNDRLSDEMSNVDKTIDGYAKALYGYLAAKYYRAEFQAWLDEEITSGESRPFETDCRQLAQERVIKGVSFQFPETPHQLPETLPLVTMKVLNDEVLTSKFYHEPEVSLVVDEIVDGYFSGNVFRGGKSREEFRSWYNKNLGGNVEIETAISDEGARRLKQNATRAGVSVVAVAVVLWGVFATVAM